MPMGHKPMKSLDTPATTIATTLPTGVAFSKAKPLAARIGVCAKSIHRWAAAGHIHRFKVNARVVLFDAAEVMAFVERCRVA
jgi:hypothetical protein